MSLQVAHIDHIQIAAPEGCEALAREFYGAVLGMKEIEKPSVLRARGGCWFQCGAHQLTIGVEGGFLPAQKANPTDAVINMAQHRVALTNLAVAISVVVSLPGAQRVLTS